MTKLSWQEHFKTNIQGAQETFFAGASSPPAIPFLAYCLSENLIPAREYLEWAKEALQIPLLLDEYFLANVPSTQVFHAAKSVYSWNPFCLPLAEWDGVLMVACLEVPVDFPANRPVAFILASPVLMAQTWQAYSQSQPPEVSITDSLETLLSDSDSGPKTLFDANGELQLKDEESALSASNPAIEVPEQSEGLPEGLFGDTSTPSPIANQDSGLPSFGAVTLNPLKPNSPEKLESTPDLEATKTATAHFDGETKTITMEEPALAELSVTLSAEAAAPIQAQALTPVKGPRSVEPLGPVATAEDIAALDNSGIHRAPPVAAPQSAPPMPKAPVKATTNHGMEAAYVLEKIRKNQKELFDKETMNSLRLLKPYFKKAMLLAIGDKDRVVKPLLWDENFSVQANAKVEFDLKSASAFRIVSTTQKPYHGFVTPNELHDSFFESWNQGQIPDHITVVPFFDGDLVVGMLLGIGEKSSYNRQVLQATDTIAKELSVRILKLTTLPASAAPATHPPKKSVA